MVREWHVSKKSSDKGNGSLESPFLTISKAANLALTEDKVYLLRGPPPFLRLRSLPGRCRSQTPPPKNPRGDSMDG